MQNLPQLPDRWLPLSHRLDKAGIYADELKTSMHIFHNMHDASHPKETTHTKYETCITWVRGVCGSFWTQGSPEGVLSNRRCQSVCGPSVVRL